jgi:outer membrane murein-binding lipoprotein Lpp
MIYHNQRFSTMNKVVFMMLVCTGVALAGCSSEGTKDTTGSDAALTDTATLGTSSTDSLKMVDSALKDTVSADRTRTQ